ncbi:MAG: hypothetical protein ACFE8L_03910 [Candidatus Hodarchaeota archaeon]
MGKKGKYKLLSYLIDEHLIFYKNLINPKKFIAFCFLEVEEFYPLISILSKFLIEKYITYFSIQLNTIDKNKKIVVINFEDIDKDRIIKSFNIVYESINKEGIITKLLRNNDLEKEFLAILLNGFESNIHISKNSDSILIKDNKNPRRLDFYKINFEIIDEKSSFIYCFLKIINNYNRKGFLIFHVKVDFNDNIKILAYFVEESKVFEDASSILKNLNLFFNITVLEKLKINVKDIFKFLWRLGISDNFYLLEDLKDLFLTEDQNTFSELLSFNSKFELNLLNNHIQFKRLSKKLIFIEQWCIFLVSNRLDSNYIRKVIERYHSKYYIYILLLNEKDYDKLLDIKEIKLLKRIKIINPDEFSTFNFKTLKNSNSLENS